jgi:glycosyltransferase involved in cell wall biosynthesis
MRAYTKELLERLPRVAPEFEYVAYRDGSNFGWDEQVRLPARIRHDRVNLTHYTSLYAPAFAPQPYVVTVHDLIHLRFPQFFKTSVGPYYRTVTRLVCARAARVITDDERTIADLERFLGIDPAKVRVIALGADAVFSMPVQPYEGPRPYLLYVGNHREHKDLPTLFAAWSQLSGVDLYLTGHDDLDGLAQRYENGSRRAVFLGDVSESTLAGYYGGALALVHPALCEGFGLPLLEAMTVGCAVVACADAVPGVLKSASQTFAPRDVAGLASILRGVTEDEGLRRALIARGKDVASTLDWNRCARETAGVYREVLKERS